MNPDLDLFRQLLEQFDLAFGRSGQLYNVGFKLFTILAIIELAWSGILYAVAYKDAEGVVTDFARRSFMILAAFPSGANSTSSCGMVTRSRRAGL